MDRADEELLEDEVVQQPESKRYGVYNYDSLYILCMLLIGYVCFMKSSF